MLENKNVLKIISLIIAILLWVYVMGEVNPDTKEKISDIEVTFVNTETLADEGLAVVHEQDLRDVYKRQLRQLSWNALGRTLCR